MLKTTDRFRISFAALALTVGWFSPAISQDATSKFSGYYALYSGELGDEILHPNKKDAKVRFTITGRAAARMFDYMGSGATQKYSCEDNEVERVRDNLNCGRDKRTGKTECYFGFDLHSGKSIGGVTC